MCSFYCSCASRYLGPFRVMTGLIYGYVFPSAGMCCCSRVCLRCTVCVCTYLKCIMYHMISPPAVRSLVWLMATVRSNEMISQRPFNGFHLTPSSWSWPHHLHRHCHLLRPRAQTGPSQPLVCASTTCRIQESSFSWTMSTPSESCITRPSQSSNGYT